MSENPEELEARIAAYIDGELPPAEAARLEVFLANTDPKLARQVISMIGDKHALSSLPKAKAPSDLAARIMEQVERGSLLNDVDQFVSSRRPWWQSKAAVAALLILIFGGFTWFILQNLHTTPTQWQTIVESNSPRNLASNSRKETQLAAAPAPANTVAPAPEAAPTAEAGHATTTPMDQAIATADKDTTSSDSLTRARRADEPAPYGAAALPAAPQTTAGAAPLIATEDRAAKQSESPAPILLALAAESPDDFTRLRDAIDSMSSQPAPAPSVSASGNGATGSASRFAGRGGMTGPRGGDGGGGGGGGIRQMGGRAANESTDNSLAKSNANQSFKLDQNEQSNAPQMNLPPIDDLKVQPSQVQPSVPTSTAVPYGFVSYHLSLHPAQLTQLTQQFHVKTLLDSSKTELANNSSNIERDKNIPEAPMGTAAATSPAALEAQKKAPSDDRIDCIITMTASSPATQAAPTSPAK